jgi:hypothetical protein
VRAAQAILEAVQSGHPPHHLLLGVAAFEGALAKVDALRQDIVAAEPVARGADFPAQQPVAAPAVGGPTIGLAKPATAAPQAATV